VAILSRKAARVKNGAIFPVPMALSLLLMVAW
jgi:hypothetical protein